MTVSVVIPWQDNGCPHRAAALTWVLSWWRDHHPGFQVVTAEVTGPWSKGAAVAAGLESTCGDPVIVADADVWCDPADVVSSVTAVASGAAAWSMPHATVHRLTPKATSAVLAGSPPRLGPAHLVQPPYAGVHGGGMTVASRAVHVEVPMDPRFVGWGQEDEALQVARTMLVGPCAVGSGKLGHLWHPPPQRMTRKWGSPESREQYRAYSDARTAEEMRAVVAGARAAVQGMTGRGSEAVDGDKAGRGHSHAGG